MNGLIINGISVAVDQEGFLVDLNDWSEPVAEALANAEGITLQAEHWEILRVLR